LLDGCATWPGIHQTSDFSPERTKQSSLYLLVPIYVSSISRYNTKVFGRPTLLGQLLQGWAFAHFLFVAMDLQELINKTVTGLGYELVDIEQSPRGRVLRLFVDKPEKVGGIDVEDCALVSNQLSRLLAVENVDYDRLEVSSPGLDRVLKKPKDFERYVGSEINVRLRLPMSGRRNFNGVLLGLQNDKISLRIDTGNVELDFGNVDKARLVPKFD